MRLGGTLLTAFCVLYLGWIVSMILGTMIGNLFLALFV